MDSPERSEGKSQLFAASEGNSKDSEIEQDNEDVFCGKYDYEPDNNMHVIKWIVG